MIQCWLLNGGEQWCNIQSGVNIIRHNEDFSSLHKVCIAGSVWKKMLSGPPLLHFKLLWRFFFVISSLIPVLSCHSYWWLVRDVTVMSQQWACAMGLESQRVEIGRGMGQGSASKKYSLLTNREPPPAPGEDSQRDASIAPPPAV